MKRSKRIWVVVVAIAVVGAACEPTMTSSREAPVEAPEGTDAGERLDEPAPLPAPTSPRPPDNGDGTKVGVERVVDGSPSSTVPVVVTVPADDVPSADPGLRLVGVTPSQGSAFELDGAVVSEEFDARLEVDEDVAVDRVAWEIDGQTFRDDDLNEPFTLRYASQPFPLNSWVDSDQELPGRFRAVVGSSVEVTATVFLDGETTEVQAVFAVGSDGEQPDPATTTTAAPAAAAPAATTTTAAPAATTTTAAPPATTTAPPATPTTVTTPAPPPSGAVPWSIPGGQTVAVSLPQGTLGPRTATGIDPSTVDGISFGGGVWTMNRDWDELSDGGYLDFGAAALRPNGHQVLGFRIEVPSNVAGGHLIDSGGEVGWFEISNPNQFSHNSFIRHEMHAHHYIAGGWWVMPSRSGLGSAHHHDAYIEMDVRPGGSTDKHYDGVQVFNQGTLRLERVVIEWADAGMIANTTGALFTQTNAALYSPRSTRAQSRRNLATRSLVGCRRSRRRPDPADRPAPAQQQQPGQVGADGCGQGHERERDLRRVERRCRCR